MLRKFYKESKGEINLPTGGRSSLRLPKRPDHCAPADQCKRRNPWPRFRLQQSAAAAVIKIDNGNKYFITDEYLRAGRVQDEIEDDLRRLQVESSFRQVYPDPAEPDRIENMKRHGFSVREVDKNVVLGIDRVRELIRKRQLFVFNTCKSTLDEFNSYYYDPEKPKEEPVKENDHLMDAIRYAIYNHNAKVMQMPKPTTGLVKPFPGMAA
jgi:Terminase RNaseH-like domain